MKQQESNDLSALMQQYLDNELIDAALSQVQAARHCSISEVDSTHESLIDTRLQPSTPATEKSPSQREFTQEIIEIAATVLKIPLAIMDSKENMARYGVDSIIVTEIMKRISDLLDLPIAPTLFFEARHLEELAVILFKRYHTRIIARYTENSPDTGDDDEALYNAEPDADSLDAEVQGWLAKYKAITAEQPSSINAPQPAPQNEHKPEAAEYVYEPIAVIAMEGQFADSANLEEFEQHLRHGDDCIRTVPPERWDWQAVFGDPQQGEFTRVKYGGFVPDIDNFDPLFFGMSPREAELMDPQHRLFIQCVWKLIESAGYAPRSFSDKKIGLFMGINLQDYAHLIDRAGAMEAMHLTSLGHMFCPNRLSFLLNIHGPSQVIDTACSSSLVALHRAILSIQHEGCEMAIAGGANLMISPDMHIMYSKVGMICEDGRCKTFSSEANGYVRGDGIGAVLLKKLSRAKADGDTIIGVIRGSAENHGGLSTSLTAPNPKAQASLIVEAQQRAEIDPRSISYIECHGTGTSLGDPIEINGLKMAFAERLEQSGLALTDTAYCGLGSVKSNIGHAETAAGIAGVIKVLLALQNKYLYPTLHCTEINPLIELEQSPFYIMQQGKVWQRPVIDGKEQVRRAGVSSFGAGGSNAHVIVEEYCDETFGDYTAIGPVLIVLSAKNDRRLKQQVENLYVFLSAGQRAVTLQLLDIAYTLQIGREAMEERLAVIVESFSELVEKLKAVTEGREETVNGLYRANIKQHKETRLVLEQRPLNMDPRPSSEKLAELATHWVKGVDLDWQQLYTDAAYGRQPRRIKLPTYPFARQRYWIPQKAIAKRDSRRSVHGAGQLHSLLQKNTSILSEQRFSSQFSGEEFFLADHVMMGKKMLPGVAYLEMALSAVQQSTDKGQIRLQNVVWARPYVFDDQAGVLHIGLYPDTDTQIRYQIYSGSDKDNKLVHSQGVAVLNDDDTNYKPALLDLVALRSRITAEPATQHSVSGAQCYAAFNTLTMAYGSGHRGIETLYFGRPDLSQNEVQVLAKLVLPACVANSFDQFTLHPSLMDSALQACIGLLFGSDSALPSIQTDNKADISTSKPSLPFALESLQILGPLPTTLWAWIRHAPGGSKGKVQKLDIDLCNEQGEVCVRMQGFSSRVADTEPRPDDKTHGLLMSRPVWQNASVVSPLAHPSYVRHVVMLYGLDQIQPETVAAGIDNARCLRLATEAATLPLRYQDIAVQVLTTIKGLLDGRFNGSILIQILIPAQGEGQLFAGLSGLLKSGAREHPGIFGQLIEVDAAETEQGLLDKIRDNSGAPEDMQIRYRGGNREVMAWDDVELSATVYPVWKNNGVYLITGGAGGLGRLFVKEISDTASAAVLILAGRSRLNQAQLEQLQQLAKPGARIEYRQLDVSNAVEVDALIDSLLTTFGRIDGILHTAGVLQDNFVVKKTAAELATVFAPKVAGTVNLDHATQALDLDFFVLFSSVAGGLGSAGQADYAAANAFMDVYADYRNAQVAAHKRRGHTLSIMWPLWQEGGMRMDAATQAMMTANTGMIPLQTASGMTAFYQMFATGLSQVMVMEGTTARIKEQLLQRPERVVQAQTTAVSAPAIDNDKLVAQIEQALLQAVSELMKFDIEELDTASELSEYGFDSISFTEFANKLNQQYVLALTPTSFFEYPTIAEFARYLSANYPAVFISALGLPLSTETVTMQLQQRDTEAMQPQQRFMPDSVQPIMPAQTASDEAIAIIGMSGRFPMADDLETFWENLQAGKDCVSEIPKDRWDWQAVYGDPNHDSNKTNIKWGAFIDGVGNFDAQFFGISPREAELMDPQQRLLMEYVWAVIEDAGYSPHSLSGSKTGMFIATASSGYGELIVKHQIAIDSYSATGTVGSVGPNRMSYFLNLHGPSEPIETACSSSLVAIHKALQAIKYGDCEQAIVGGINLIVVPETHISFNKAGMLCEDGRCKTFSSQANGYVRGEGVGMLMLKKLSAAEQAGDHIYGVIRASAENHGGRANSLTAPNPKAQTDLLKTAYSRAGIDPRTIGYIEAHGTGTELGDPIEINALKSAFKELYQSTGSPQIDAAHCGVGAVKTHIGHLELAAGIAGVIKVLLQLKHKTLVKNLHCDEVNPYIQLQDSPLYLVRENRGWQPVIDGQGLIYPRRAGVSSFGFGGVNAHVVLEEYPESDEPQSISSTPQIIVLSARTNEALQASASRLLAFIRKHKLVPARPTAQKLALVLGQKLTEWVAGLLQVDAADISLEERFVDYGLDPVQQTMLLAQLQQALSITVPVKVFLKYGSIAAIVAGLVEEQPEVMAKLDHEDADVEVPTGQVQSSLNLIDLAYTLQVGRAAMEERLGFIVHSIAELEEKLRQFVDGGGDNADIYVGQVRLNKNILNAFATDQELQEVVNNCFRDNKFIRLLELWAKGLAIDWHKLYDNARKPRRISLPTYPFAKERHWVDPAAGGLETSVFKPVVATELQRPFQASGQSAIDTTGSQMAASQDAWLAAKTRQFLIELLAVKLKLPVQRIKADAELEKYGIDSLMILELTNTLEKTFGSLSKTLFFEYQTLNELADYFLDAHRERLQTLFRLDESSKIPEQVDGNLASHTDQPAIPQEQILGNLASASSPQPQPLNIAIIGLAGRYPQAENLEEYWQNLRDGKDCITEIPQERWNWQEYYTEDRSQSGGHNSKWGGFIADVDKFDPLFFNISPREAETMDPQERLFLEHAWMALEDAGYSPESLQQPAGPAQPEDLPAQVGVYVGVMYSEYQLFGAESTLLGEPLVTSGSYASIANRVSYLLNLHGPSMTLDTMCSSSITALHLACQDLQMGRTQLALAGGVNVSIHPNKYAMLSRGQFISTNGHCESFGEGGDGYVPGEGVGVAVLKRLVDAERDGDHIYGVIKGSAVNHGGKTNGYSVPNPKAQQHVIAQALRQAHIDSQAVSYIEAHGTGTKLGDPIEITGLTKAFRKYTEDNQYCWLGSAKSNIGHCESAAGIAGISKVLLQMQHGQIAPSLHSQVLNPYIDFAATPFIVNQELRTWQRPVRDGQTLPRIAGISSFGAGGSNAHLVIQEYVKTQIRLPVEEEAYAVVLSAKTLDQLQVYANKLLQHIKIGADGLRTDISLQDLSYTLQIGRQAMSERLGLIAGSLNELAEKLAGFLASSDTLDATIYYARVKGDSEHTGDMGDAITAWLQQHQYAKLLELWVQGAAIPWHKLYSQATRPYRISLPTYPFARERYWIAPVAGYSRLTADNSSRTTMLHPLLHENTSDLTGQRYTSTLTKQAFFLRDHQVQGQLVLPAVAYLEMARAAMQHAGGFGKGRQGALAALPMRLKNIVWARPLVVNYDALPVHIILAHQEQHSLTKSNDIRYEIYTASEHDQSARVIYSQGSAVCDPSLSGIPAALDIEGLKAQLNNTLLSAEQCYQAFEEIGIVYGPGHRALHTLYINDAKPQRPQVLARLILPAVVSAEYPGQFVLHPALLDAALQAGIGLAHGNASSRPALPFALDELDIYNPCTADMWAWLRYADGYGPDAKRQKLDIDLCDDQGKVCVRLKGLSLRVMDGFKTNPPPALHSTEDNIDSLLFYPDWQEKAPALQTGTANYAAHHVVLCGTDADLQIPGVSCLHLQTDETDTDKRFEAYAIQLFDEIRRVLAGMQGKVLFQVMAIGDDPVHGLPYYGLAGLLKTAHLENPNFIGQLISLESPANSQELISRLQENSTSIGNQRIRYKNGQRQVEVWQPFTMNMPVIMPWREGGVYLITGGMGGLGFIFAKEIAAQTRNVKLILTGRSLLNGSAAGMHIQERLDELTVLGARVVYRAVDVSRKAAVFDLIQEIQADYAESLNGIIHCAGVTRDNFILKKTQAEWREVLAPKVSGLVNLDQATNHLALDFFILFSSVASMGNPGQADYAAANAFMDAYADYRNKLVSGTLSEPNNPVRPQGLTLSVNWPLWAEGGMDVGQALKDVMKQTLGLIPLTTATGIRALYQSLMTGQSQVLVLDGELSRLKAMLPGQAALQETPIPSATNKTVVVSAPVELQEKLNHYLKNLLVTMLKLPLHRIETDVPLEKYGIDSVAVMSLTSELEKTFGSLPKTLLFEYPTLDALNSYLIANHAQQINVWSGNKLHSLAERHSPVSVSVTDDVPVAEMAKQKHLLFSAVEPLQQRPQQISVSTDIAIIGVAGRFPGAANVAEFWTNLSEGRDSITEIPKERWDYRKYFDTDKNRPGFSYSKWGGFLDGVDQFDPLFFNISPQEAALIDPMERLFLESVWNLLEGTGNLGETLQHRYQSRVGVYVGAMYQQYQACAADIDNAKVMPPASYSAIANRVSCFFDFQGPSIAIDTMCSSSIVAVHLACESLLRGECKLAVAGGVNLTLHPDKYIGLSQGQLLGSHPHSTSFGDGDGYIPAESVGAVLLKPLSAAIADRDNILAVIKSTAINHSGQANGYAVPNPNAQAQLLEDNFAKAGIHPRTISYVEAAANGSLLGDAIELAALNKVFQKFTNDRQFCVIGSVKSNIGHAEAASGISQLAKVILQLQHRQLAPSIKAEPLNPNIDFSNTPFYLQRGLQTWSRPVIRIDDADSYGEECEYPRRAALNSFGAGGTNAHLIVEEFVTMDQENIADSVQTVPHLVLFSAGNAERLQAVVKQMLVFIEEQPALNLADFAYTLQVGRVAMESRLALVVNDRAELIDSLQEYLNAVNSHAVISSDSLFTGDLTEDNSQIRQLVSGQTGQTVLQMLLAEKELAKLALYWAKGVTVSWQALYEGTTVRRIALPTYPFAKARYWITADKSGASATAPDIRASAGHLPVRENMQQYLLACFSDALGLPVSALNAHKNLRDYGVNSLLGQGVMRGFADRFQLKTSARDLLAYPTIAALTEYFSARADQQPDKNTPARLQQTHDPELPVDMPLSEGQKGLWLLHKLAPDMSAYNVPIAFRFREALDIDSLKQACAWMLANYPLLRAVIREENGVPYQTISAQGSLPFHQEKTEELDEAALLALVRNKSKEPFELDKGPLLRVHIFPCRTQQPVVLITIHHIVFDGRSALLFIQNLCAAYQAYAQGREAERIAQEADYRDFVQWEQTLLGSAEGQEHLSYWQQQFSGELPFCTLPADYPRPSVQRFAGSRYETILEPVLAGHLKQLANHYAVNLSMVFLAAFKVLLFRYTGQDDILVGMPTQGRPQQRFDEVIGYFINMIVIRSRLSEQQTFADLLKSIQLTVADGLDHAAYPLPTLINALKVRRDPAIAPLFQISYAYQNFASAPGLKKLAVQEQAFPQLEMLKGIHQEGADDFGLEIYEDDERFIVNMDYNCDLFAATTVQRIMVHYLGLLEAIAKAPELPISHYQFVSAEETTRILQEWSQAQAESVQTAQSFRAIHQLFAEQARKTPKKTAIVFGNDRLSYKELNKRSSYLARYLRKQGVKANHLVAVCMPRSLAAVVSLLAIMKAGGVYVPVDPELPDSRIRQIVQDSGAGILLTQSELAEKMSALVSGTDCKLCFVDKIRHKSWSYIGRVTTKLRAEQPAYIIYTSGSTGKPKGVLVSHEAIATHCQTVKTYYQLTAQDCLLQFAPFAVDASLEQLLPGLITGATVILRDNALWSTQQFREKVLQYGLSVVDIPPSYLHELLLESSQNFDVQFLSTLRLVITGGEALTAQTTKLWRSSVFSGIRLVNAYGPTETTITSTVFDVSDSGSVTYVNQTVPIGRPLPGETVYILDKQGCLVPTGVAGELHIGGAGVALGYLNQPELTQEKFIDNPFRPDRKLYKTGDLVCWLADGNIEFLGRVDHQVKIRGFRIECGEIESLLKAHPAVRDALVLAKTVNGNSQLIAYIVPANTGQLIETIDLKNMLQAQLPGYMIPAAFMTIPELPLTPVGKTDRNALLQYAIETVSPQHYAAPGTETERQLAGIWANLLAVERVGIYDNFFDLGGHSLLAVRLMAEIKKAFGRDLSLSKLLQNPTIAALADSLKQHDNQAWTPLVGIQTAGNKPPLFCIHAAGGYALCYRELASLLGDQQPCYGLEARGLNGGEAHDSIEAMVACYIAEIQTLQPQGPYYLGGWSLGGVIAYEMARQLQEAGEQVALLALFDSYTPKQVQSVERDYANKHKLQDSDQETLLLTSFARDLGLAVQLPLSGGSLAEHLAQLAGQLTASTGLHGQNLHDLFKVYKTHTLAMNQYQLQTYTGAIKLFTADKALVSNTSSYHEPEGWFEWVTGRIEVIEIPGDHYTLLQGENVRFLAGELKKYLG